jgi:hypothetical protein
MLQLRREDVCVVCSSALVAGSRAWWDAESRTVTCTVCRQATIGSGPARIGRSELDRGRPGASVAREYQRRKSSREARTRDAHPRIGGLLLAVRSAPQHELAFHRGELGERAVGASLEKRTADGPAIVLHDRRMPGGFGNIDHLAISPNGVFVIDAKNYDGKVRVVKPFFGPPKLLINERNRTKLLDGLDRQVSTVGDALRASGQPAVPIQGVLCFTDADLPLLGTLKIRGHILVYRKALAKRLNATGPLGPSAIDALARALASALPSA